MFSVVLHYFDCSSCRMACEWFAANLINQNQNNFENCANDQKILIRFQCEFESWKDCLLLRQQTAVYACRSICTNKQMNKQICTWISNSYQNTRNMRQSQFAVFSSNYLNDSKQYKRPSEPLLLVIELFEKFLSIWLSGVPIVTIKMKLFAVILLIGVIAISVGAQIGKILYRFERIWVLLWDFVIVLSALNLIFSLLYFCYVEAHFCPDSNHPQPQCCKSGKKANMLLIVMIFIFYTFLSKIIVINLHSSEFSTWSKEVLDFELHKPYW